MPVFRVVLESAVDGDAAAPPLRRSPLVQADDARKIQLEERRHRLFISAMISGTLILFLFAINIFSGGEFWFQWPTLAILLVFALRTIRLFRKRI